MYTYTHTHTNARDALSVDVRFVGLGRLDVAAGLGREVHGDGARLCAYSQKSVAWYAMCVCVSVCARARAVQRQGCRMHLVHLLYKDAIESVFFENVNV